MKVLRSTTALAVAGLIGAFGAAASTTAAEAATPSATTGAVSAAAVSPNSMSDCSATYFCFWNNAGFNDGPGKLSGNNSSFFAFSHSSCPNGTWANCISSIYNEGTSGMGVEVFSGTGYGGHGACIPDNASYSNLSYAYYPGTSVNMNDTIESNQWTWGC